MPHKTSSPNASVSEGLDLGFTLLADRIDSLDIPDRTTGERLLKGMCRFVSSRRAGETEPAFEALLSLGDLVDDEDWPDRLRFWDQLERLRDRTGGALDVMKRKVRYWGSV